MFVDSGCIFMKDPKLAFPWIKLGVQVLLANSMELRTANLLILVELSMGLWQ